MCIRDSLLDHLWPQQFVGDATLKSCIKEARQAVGDTGKAQRIIQTLHGRGYRFVAAVEEARESPPAETMISLLTSPRMSVTEDLGPVVAPALVLEATVHAAAENRDTSLAILAGERKQVTILCCALANA